MMNPHFLTLVAIFGLAIFQAAQAQEPAATTLRAGMIGLDTSHAPAFARIFNDPKATGDLAGVKIIAGYPGGTDTPLSRERVGKFTEELRGMGIEIVDSIPKLLEKVDVVLLESVDGRIHLHEATLAIQAGKPLFIERSKLQSSQFSTRRPGTGSKSLRFRVRRVAS